MSGGQSKVYWVSYPDPAARKIKMRIATGQLDAANGGNVDAQNAICMRYKMAVGLPRDFRVWWNILKQNIKPSRDTLDTKEARKQSNKKMRARVKDWHPDIGEGGCGCKCFNCDIRMVHCCNRETGCKAVRP